MGSHENSRAMGHFRHPKCIYEHIGPCACEWCHKGPPPPESILYADDHDPPLFLTGELNHMICETQNCTRELLLWWRGLHAELRPRELERVGNLVERMKAATIELHKVGNELSAVLDREYENGRPYPPETAPAPEAIEGLTPDQRVEFFDACRDRWCIHCGNDHPKRGRCRCEDDS